MHGKRAEPRMKQGVRLWAMEKNRRQTGVSELIDEA